MLQVCGNALSVWERFEWVVMLSGVVMLYKNEKYRCDIEIFFFVSLPFLEMATTS
jgi:hypothetical protein